MSEPFLFAGHEVPPGGRRQISLPAGRLPSGTELSLPIEVLHGHRPGPTVWLSGAIHGDEIVGVEIIRRVLERLNDQALAGTLIAIPVVNVFGFVSESRYLPDRRDLNRSFPGSSRGSLASRLARVFVDEVVKPSDFGIDFHAGSDDRTNLPQIRANMADDETAQLALAFAPPLVLHAKTIRGSLRETALKLGKKILLFEGGEPRRFSPAAVNTGVAGALRVLAAVGIVESGGSLHIDPPSKPPAQSDSTTWVRASRGGIFRLGVRLGDRVAKGELLGIIGDPSDRGGSEVRARVGGLVMGHAVNPLVHRGDGIVHIAELE